MGGNTHTKANKYLCYYTADLKFGYQLYGKEKEISRYMNKRNYSLNQPSIQLSVS